MILTDFYSLTIPTHIEFTLFRYDYIDGILISRINKHCKNYSTKDDDDFFTIKKSDMIRVIKSSPKLKNEFLKKNKETKKPNSVYFLGLLIDKLVNLELLSFKISYDKEYTRLIKHNNTSIVNFDFFIQEGFIDLPSIFSIKELDEFNKLVISNGLMKNKYLYRKPFFKMDSLTFFEILSLMEIDGYESATDLLDFLDPKLEEDNTDLIIKTDYTIY